MDSPATTNRIRILYAIEDLNVGGAERLLIQIATHLNRDNFEPLVCCLTQRGRLADEVERNGIDVIELGKKPGIDLPIAFRLAALIRRHRIDIVHTHLFTADLWGRVAGILTGVKALVTTEHSLAPWKDTKRIWVDRLLDRFTDQIIAVTGAVRESLMARRDVPADKITLIHNAVGVAPSRTIEKSNRLREQFALPLGAPVIASVGRLSEEKGHDLLLRAAPAIMAAWPTVRLVLIGDGPERNSLEALAEELGVAERTIFAGVRSDVREILSMVTLFVLPSRTEGLSLALLEAMAAGAPVVATAVGGTPEIIEHNQNGLLVPAENAPALAQACIGLLENAETAAALGRAAQTTVENHYSLDRMMERTESVYRSALLR